MKKNYWVQAGVIAAAAVIAFCIILLKHHFREMDRIRNLQISEVSLSAVKDGIYRGSFTYGGFTYKVDVSVKSNRYESIAVVTNRATDYAKKAEAILLAVVSNQSLTNLDAHTGATTTTKAFLKAVENSFTNKIK